MLLQMSPNTMKYIIYNPKLDIVRIKLMKYIDLLPIIINPNSYKLSSFPGTMSLMTKYKSQLFVVKYAVIKHKTIPIGKPA